MTTQATIVGIDPGLSGAVVAIDNACALLGFFDCPTNKLSTKSAKRDFSERRMIDGLRQLLAKTGITKDRTQIWIEKQWAQPRDGKTGAFKNGCGFGIWRAICAAEGYQYSLVAPRTWQKPMLSGVSGDDTKKKSIARAEQLFPSLETVITGPRGGITLLDGRSDASLIAAYGLRQFTGAL